MVAHERVRCFTLWKLIDLIWKPETPSPSEDVEGYCSLQRLFTNRRSLMVKGSKRAYSESYSEIGFTQVLRIMGA